MYGDMEGRMFWLKVWVEKYIISWNIEFHCLCASALHLMKYNSLCALHITNWHISSAYGFEFDMCEENAVFFPSHSFVHSIGMCRMWWLLAILRSLFPSSLLCTFSCHPSTPTILLSSLTSSCHLFLGLPVSLVVSDSCIILFWEFCFLPFCVDAQTNVIYLTFRHHASCILGQAFHFSSENAFYIFNQQIYFIIWYLFDHASLI